MAGSRIALIKPGLGAVGGRPYRSKACMEPLALAVLAGMTPDNTAITVFDDRYEAVPFDEHYDLVGITVTTFTAQRSYEIADAYRSRGIPVVLEESIRPFSRVRPWSTPIPSWWEKQKGSGRKSWKISSEVPLGEPTATLSLQTFPAYVLIGPYSRRNAMPRWA